MHTCDKCQQFGLQFNRLYRPVEFIEGSPESPVWIVGLNPAIETDWVDNRTAGELRNYFDGKDAVHPYFRDFKTVSQLLYASLGSGGAAHTDLVKCYSKQWPPDGAGTNGRRFIIASCQEFFLEQLERFKPQMLICNGADVCSTMKTLLPPPSGTSLDATSYISSFKSQRVCVVLSGFVGRIDNYAKRRLGIEIEMRLREMGLRDS